MGVGEFIGMGFLVAVCMAFGGMLGWAFTMMYYQNKKAKAIDKFLRKKLSARDYLKLQDFMIKEVEDVAPVIIFLQNKLNASDFQRYVELAEIKDLQEEK